MKDSVEVFTDKNKLVHGYFIHRDNRFVVTVRLDNGSEVKAHCNNSGSMKTCIEKEAEIYLSPAEKSARKTRYNWEMIKINNSWVGINTVLPNEIVARWIKKGIITSFSKYEKVEREKKFRDSRFDIRLSSGDDICYVEVKNVTMKIGSYGRFPDAPTERGKKHLDTLVKVRNAGFRAVMIYAVQRTDVSRFGPASDIDPLYAEKMKKAHRSGVEIIALCIEISPGTVALKRVLPVDF